MALIKMDGKLPSERKSVADWNTPKPYKTYPRGYQYSEQGRTNYDLIDWSKGKPMGKYKKGKTSKAYNA